VKFRLRRQRRLRAVLPAVGVLGLIVGCGLTTASGVLASSASAAARHVESGTPGQDAVTAFGAAAPAGRPE
jgi:hypothetical protein